MKERRKGNSRERRMWKIVNISKTGLKEDKGEWMEILIKYFNVFQIFNTCFTFY